MDLRNEKIVGLDRSEFYENYAKVLQSLPPDISLQLKKARTYFTTAGGLKGITKFYETFNGQSASFIIDKHKQENVNTQVLASGQIDGTTFVLHRPDTDTTSPQKTD